MPKKHNLTELKRKEIIAIIGIGCSIETASKYVGCTPEIIRQEMKNNPKFAEDVRSSGEQAEIFFVEKIRKAANKEQYWRAAAWALERRCPNRYSARGSQTLSEDQILQLVTELTDIVIPEINDGKERQRILRKVKQLIRTLNATGDTLELEIEKTDGDIEEMV